MGIAFVDPAPGGNVFEGKKIPTSDIVRGGETRPGNTFDVPGSPSGERDHDENHTMKHRNGSSSPGKVVLRRIKSGNFHFFSDDQIKEECEPCGEFQAVSRIAVRVAMLMCRGSMFPSHHHSRSRRF